MKLPLSFTTVTTLSKLLALFLFILFPLVGFKFGMEYQKIENGSKYYVAKGKQCFLVFFSCPTNHEHFSDSVGCGCKQIEQPIVTPTQTDDMSNQVPVGDLTGWKTYTNKKYSYTIKYPSDLSVGNGIDPESAFDYVDNLYLNDKDGNFVDIYHQENPNNLQVEDWLNSGEGRFFNNNSNYKSLNISSLTWYVFDPPLAFSLDQSAFKWGLFNDLDIFLVGNKTKLSDGTVERILSTFRFLDEE